MSLILIYEEMLAKLLEACRNHYGDRLVSLLAFGSVGRKTPRPDSDIDLLIVAEDLPKGRLPRVQEFDRIEADLSQALEQAAQAGVRMELSPVFKTPDEVERGSLLFLDMIYDRNILYDRDNFMQNALSRFESRLKELGANRIWSGNAWYWDLKPDFRPGEVFEI